MELGNEMALEAREVSHRVGGRLVLNRVSFSLRSGEMVALLGPNGAGKTTLLRTLLGFERPSSGQVLLDGVPLRRLSRREIARSVAYIPQSHIPAFPYRVRDLVLLGRTPSSGLFRRFRPRDREQAEAALENVGLSALGDRPYTQLSGGERQLVLIARALAQGARLILMDEPFSSVDYGHRHRLLRHLRDLVARGIGVALTTHDPEQAMRLSTRAVLLVEGRVMADGPPTAVLTPTDIWSLYQVRVEVLSVGESRAVLCPTPE